MLVEMRKKPNHTVRPHSALGGWPPAPEEVAARPTSASLRSDRRQSTRFGDFTEALVGSAGGGHERQTCCEAELRPKNCRTQSIRCHRATACFARFPRLQSHLNRGERAQGRADVSTHRARNTHAGRSALHLCPQIGTRPSIETPASFVARPVPTPAMQGFLLASRSQRVDWRCVRRVSRFGSAAAQALASLRCHLGALRGQFGTSRSRRRPGLRSPA